MAISSSKYVKVETIYQKLTKIIKQKEISLFDVVDWSAECTLNEIGIVRDFYLVEDHALTIADYQAVLPDNCWRVIRVKRNNAPLNFYDNGNYLNFKKNYSNVYLDYYGIPVDSVSGFPLVIRGHEDACMYYCMKMLYMEDYLSGLLDQNRWNTIQMNYDRELSLASSKSDRTTENDRVAVMDAARRISHNYRNFSNRRDG